MPARRIVLALHKWIGIGGAAFLVVIALSGYFAGALALAALVVTGLLMWSNARASRRTS